jgi:hypothetical protein
MKKLFTSNNPAICKHYHGYNPNAFKCIQCLFKDKEIEAVNAKGSFQISSHSFVLFYEDDKIQVLKCENCYHMDFSYYRYSNQDFNC